VHHAHGVTADYKIDAYRLAQLGFNGQPLEWHFFSDAQHGFRHPDNEGFQPHYADTAWPLVVDFLQRRV
jgi:dienelactone hydrolase